MKRNILEGDESVMLSCNSTGIPAVRIEWFHNGNLVTRIQGIEVNNAQLTISNPKPVHSGMYQCFVSNGVVAPLEDVQRTWTVEIIRPSK